MMIKNDGKNSDNNDEEINDIDDHCERMLISTKMLKICIKMKIFSTCSPLSPLPILFVPLSF